MPRKIPKYEFKPDPSGTDFLKKLYLTPAQQRRITKWVLYFLLFMAAWLVPELLLANWVNQY